MQIEDFKKLPIIGILRGVEEDMIQPLTTCIIDSGLKTVEITMNTPCAAALIHQMKQIAGEQLTIGAGTVLGMDDLNNALAAGASFIVMPLCIKEVVEYCKNHDIPVFPGALTPSEVFSAWDAGATMVKVFPSSVFGPKYFKELTAPLNKVELLACGGVSAGNIAEFFAMGASGAAFGASIFKNEWLKQAQYDKIKYETRHLIEAYNKGI